MKNKTNYMKVLIAGALISSVLPSATLSYAESKKEDIPVKNKQNGLLGSFYGNKDFKDLVMLRGNSGVNEKK
ncbi:hypothetical protein, partial [Bacillus mycoides]